MSGHIGLVVGSEWIRVAVARDARIVWVDEHRVENGDFCAGVTELISHVPNPRRRRIATLALGCATGQIKRLRDVPPLRSTAALAKLVSTNANRYFVGPYQDRIIGVLPSAEAGVWAASLELTMIRDLVRVCEHLGCRVRGVTTDALAVAAHMKEGEVLVRDGAITTRGTVSGGSLVRLERIWDDSVDCDVPIRSKAAAAQLVEVDARFHVACCAALVDRSALLFGVAEVIRRTAPAHWRVAVATGTFVAALLTWLIVPLAVARSQLSGATDWMAVHGVEADVAAQAERDLAEVEAVLRELHARDPQRRPVLQVLQSISDVLPAEVAIEHIRMTAEQELHVELLTAGTGSVVTAVEAIPYVADVRIVGPVRRQAIAGVGYDRISLVIQFTVGGNGG
jgi:Tfp pilus assembly protein PilN